MMGKVLMIGSLALSLGACAMEKGTGLAAQGSGYSEAQIETASRAACQAYGISPATARYERCVRNEYASRSPG
ncbi:hypothetical protein BH11PSE3_BH11PSE3_18300 [soil metagenome]